MADHFPEGWGQGLEPGDGEPALAMNDSNAKFNLTTCPVHANPASPGEKGAKARARLPKGNATATHLPQGKKRTPTSNPSPKEQRQPQTKSSVPIVHLTTGRPDLSADLVGTNFPGLSSGTPTRHPPRRKGLARPVRNKVGVDHHPLLFPLGLPLLLL